jgi:hypothetical protein
MVSVVTPPSIAPMVHVLGMGERMRGGVGGRVLGRCGGCAGREEWGVCAARCGVAGGRRG